MEAQLSWGQFLDKIRVYKKDFETGQVDLRAAPLITLLFAGAFDQMIGRAPSVFEYKSLTEDLLKALGSKAKLPTKKKTDLIGIDGIESDLDLHMWRSDANPTYRFDFTSLFDSFLKSMSFIKRPDSDKDFSYRRPSDDVTGREEALIFRSQKVLFDTPAYERYMRRDCQTLVGLVGIIKDFRVRTTKTGKEMGTFRLFMGDGFSHPIYVWPSWVKNSETGRRESSDFISHKVKQQIRNGRSGIAFVKPGKWNNNPQYTLVGFEGSNEKVGTK